LRDVETIVYDLVKYRSKGTGKENHLRALYVQHCRSSRIS